MAGDWIKILSSTPDKPELLKIARILNCDRDLVLGKLIRLWIWFDLNSVDGHVDAVVDADVDALVSHCGFCEALRVVNWYQSDATTERIWLPNFTRHNGETAKKRAEKAARMARWRAGKAVDADVLQARLPEKRREENNTPLPPKGGEVGDFTKPEPEDFISFWEWYPRKYARPAALRAWRSLDPDQQTITAIADSILKWKRSEQWKKDSGTMIPSPAKFLRQRLWETPPDVTGPKVETDDERRARIAAKRKANEEEIRILKLERNATK